MDHREMSLAGKRRMEPAKESNTSITGLRMFPLLARCNKIAGTPM
jgi:hypothetical protein